MRNTHQIYLDYASTTPVDPRVVQVMRPYFSENFGNTMTMSKEGRDAKIAVESARSLIAEILGARPSEIIFTGSATESNNHALKGIACARKEQGGHIIVSSLEHESVRASAEWLAQNGFKVTSVGVDKEGIVDMKELERAIRKDTILVSVMASSNEVGTIQPIKKIGALCKKRDVLFHTDAVQAFGKIPINVHDMKIDLLSASSHKIYGPKGAACLFVRQGVALEPFMHGGSHEEGRRAGTLNVPAIVGFGKASSLCAHDMSKEHDRLTQLRDTLIADVLNTIPHTGLIGSATSRISNHASFWIEGVRGEDMVLALDQEGISIGTGSACATVKMEPSVALQSLGLSHKHNESSIRVTLGRYTSKRDILLCIKVLQKVVKALRERSS